MRTRLSIVILLCFLAMGWKTTVWAQEAGTPTAGEGFGLPALNITVTDSGWEAPAEIAAGRYALTVNYNGSEEFGTAAFARLPADQSFDDLLAAMAIEQAAEATALAASPAASDGTAVESTDDSTPLVDWLYTMTYAGGLSVLSGETSQGVIDLSPGNWVIWADNFETQPQPLTVTGEMPSDLTEPVSTATITQINVGDHFGWRIDGDITAGQNILKIANASDNPHILEFVGISQPVTPLEFFSMLQQSETGEPLANVPVPDGAEITFTSAYAATLSSGMTQWVIVDLDPGSYYMTCWVRDRNDPGLAHSALGELELLTID
jgi:hypothetical protein